MKKILLKSGPVAIVIQDILYMIAGIRADIMTKRIIKRNKTKVEK